MENKMNINIIDVLAASSNSVCIDDNGICYGFGESLYRGCGVGWTTIRILSPEAVDLSADHKIVIILVLITIIYTEKKENISSLDQMNTINVHYHQPA